MMSNKTGVITILLVYNLEGKQVGMGYVVWYGPFPHKPELVNTTGGELEEGEYTLVPTNQQLTILNFGVH